MTGLFVQLNARLVEEGDRWQEKSRWPNLLESAWRIRFFQGEEKITHTLFNLVNFYFLKVGEIPRRCWLIWEMEQAICPLLPSLPLLIAPGFPVWDLFKEIFFFLQEKLEHGVVLLDATGQTIDEILGKAANEKVKVLKPSSFWRWGPGNKSWRPPEREAEGGDPPPLHTGSEAQDADEHPPPSVQDLGVPSGSYGKPRGWGSDRRGREWGESHCEEDLHC